MYNSNENSIISLNCCSLGVRIFHLFYIINNIENQILNFDIISTNLLCKSNILNLWCHHHPPYIRVRPTGHRPSLSESSWVV